MTDEEKVRELFAALKKRPPYITEEYVRKLVHDSVLQRQARRSKFDFFLIYKTRFIWATVGAVLLLLCLTFLLKPGKTIKEPIAVTQPQAEMKQVAPVPKSDLQVSKSRKQTAPDKPDLRVNDDAHKRSNPSPAFKSTPVNWIPVRNDSIKIYELDSIELKKFDLQVLPNGDLKLQSIGMDITLLHSNDTTGRRMLKFGKKKSGEVSIPISANLVTDEKGRISSFLKTDMNKIPAFQKMVPIKVVVRNNIDTSKENRLRSYIFWYEYSEKFLLFLPERIKKELQSDMEKQLKQNGSPDRQLFTNIESVPKSKTIIVDYQNYNEGKTAFSIYDIHGNILQTITNDPECRKQICQASIPSDTFKPGVYLLSINCENGDKDVRRLYIE